jgi:hypothetical protein
MEWIIFILSCGIIKYKSKLLLLTTSVSSCSSIIQPQLLASNAWDSFESGPFPSAISTALLKNPLDVQLFCYAFLKYFRSTNLLFCSISHLAGEGASYQFAYFSNFIFLLIGTSLQSWFSKFKEISFYFSVAKQWAYSSISLPNVAKEADFQLYLRFNLIYAILFQSHLFFFVQGTFFPIKIL